MLKGTTVGHENTMESVVSRPIHEQTGNNTGLSHQTVEKTRLPDYREPPLGFFEGDPGPAVPNPAQPGSDHMQGELHKSVRVKEGSPSVSELVAKVFEWLGVACLLLTKL